MKKLIAGFFGLVLLCSGQQAYASSGNYSDDGATFKKVIHVLDDIFNDYHRRPEKVVVIAKQHPIQKVCFYNGRHKVCKISRRGHGYKYRYPRVDHYARVCSFK